LAPLGALHVVSLGVWLGALLLDEAVLARVRRGSEAVPLAVWLSLARPR
jgi:hypothetical protein